MKHGKNFILGEYVIIKKPELVEVGDNVRIADFYSSLAAGVKIWLSSNDYVNELVTHSVPCVKEIQGNVRLGKYTGVGTNSVIMPGNDIPEGVTIGALSFVPSGYKFEPWTVYAGQPIRPIKKRNRANIMRTLMKIGCIEACEEAAREERLCAE